MSEKNILTFVGDVFYPQDTGKRFFAENIVYNQEFVITNNKNLCPAEGKVNLKASEDMAKYLFAKSKNRYACIANNHIFDYGIEGFNETVQNLEKNGVDCFGEFLHDVSVCKLGDVTFCLLAYYLNAFCENAEIENKISLMKTEIADAIKKGAKKIIVSFHYGNEHYPQSSVQQKMISRVAIDEGADLVIGHHPHCIQEKEKYKGKWIYYSLGNFVFPNFECDAFFDKYNRSTQKFVWKNTSWTKRTVVVNYNLNTGDVNEVVCEWNKEILKTLRTTMNRENFLPNKAVGELRKAYLIIYWNIFTNSEIVYWKGLFNKIKSVMRSKRFKNIIKRKSNR